jgi:hypothetical protein
MTTGYVETYRRSLERPAEFWAEAAEAGLGHGRLHRAND